MLIDLLNNYPTEDHSCILETVKRWYLNEYRQSTIFDMHKEYPDAPYWGNGECEYGKCKECRYFDDEYECEEYKDKEYNEWFDDIITNYDKEWIEEIVDVFDRQVKLFDEDEEWTKIFRNEITIQLLVWLEKRNITYCIIKGLFDVDDRIYIKRNVVPDEYYALFTHTPKKYQLDYCVENHGWVCYTLEDLTHVGDIAGSDKIFDWMTENTIGCFQTLERSNETVYFEYVEDAMAVKLRWMESDY